MKQILKASQLIREKINGIEGTKLDDHFLDLERKIDITNKAVTEILLKTTEYIQPNPAYRVKLGLLSPMLKIHSWGKASECLQPEDLLGNCMLKYGQELGEDSTFGRALTDMGEAMKLMAEVKESFDINVKETFIDPLQLVHDEELKQISHHLKRLEGRRLDYDYKRRHVGKIPDNEITQAMEKFEESKAMAERCMFNFLENDVSIDPNQETLLGMETLTLSPHARLEPVGLFVRLLVQQFHHADPAGPSPGLPRTQLRPLIASLPDARS
ncbi:PREDICTED: endophilin-A3 [Myotis davidii]|uniref:endophilin-A3 n=1 Tax=Myotis davidii TaxID=225400 RepID=UPI0007672B12|nr:PREDICTED: endophilin-A3 [Myotis davidii]